MATEPITASCTEVTKVFGREEALRGVSLEVHPGHIIGLLGANGAGKSTLLRLLTGLYLPTSGRVTTFGHAPQDLPAEQMRRIGYVHQNGELPGWMTVRQLLRYVRSFYPSWNDSLEAAYVEDFEISLGKRVANLSPGQRQRVAILIAIGFDPDLLILDEPASGLDPLARARFLELLLEMIQDTERTIIISSHILSDVARVIDHAIIMHQGRILRDTSYDQLQEEFCRLRVTSGGRDLPTPLPVPNTISSKQSGSHAELVVRSPSPADIDTWSRQWQCDIETTGLGLEDIYRLVVQETQGAAPPERKPHRETRASA